MSDLITTAQDSFSDKCIEAFVMLQSAGHEVARRVRDPKGQTAAEYMGILLVAALLVAAVVGSGAAKSVGDRVKELINNISNGTDPNTGKK